MAKIDVRGPLGNIYAIQASVVNLIREIRRNIPELPPCNVMQLKELIEDSSSYEEARDILAFYVKVNYYVDITYVYEEDAY